MLSPNGSSGTCIPDGVYHIPMPCLHGATMPPVRTEHAAFTAHGSRHREFMVTSISSGFHRVHGVQLARSLSTVYRFPTLFLRAFAMYVAFPHADS